MKLHEALQVPDKNAAWLDVDGGITYIVQSWPERGFVEIIKTSEDQFFYAHEVANLEQAEGHAPVDDEGWRAENVY